jgi:hypothetical protein
MPWDEPSCDLRPWLRNFAVSSAVGLAAVFAVAIFVLPTSDSPDGGQPLEPNIASPITSPVISPQFTRTPGRPTTFNPQVMASQRNTMRMTSSQPQSPLIPTQAHTLTPWSSIDLEDLHTIIGLRETNEQLRTVVNQLREENHLLKQQLDTTTSMTKDQGGADK